MITVNCFIEPFCVYSDEHNAFAVFGYTAMITYKNRSFSRAMQQEHDLLEYFKQLLKEQYSLLPEKVQFRFVENPEEL